MTNDQRNEAILAATSRIVGQIQNEIYAICARVVGDLERDRIYTGNSHHCAQRIHEIATRLLGLTLERTVLREIVAGVYRQDDEYRKYRGALERFLASVESDMKHVQSFGLNGMTGTENLQDFLTRTGGANNG